MLELGQSCIVWCSVKCLFGIKTNLITSEVSPKNVILKMSFYSYLKKLTRFVFPHPPLNFFMGANLKCHIFDFVSFVNTMMYHMNY